MNNLESSFLHSNKLKIFTAGIDSQKEKNVAIPYGPQLNDIEYRIAASISIFWIYILILIAPRLFPSQLHKSWLEIQKESCKLFRDYIKDSQSKLFEAAELIENILETIEPSKI